MNESYIKNFDGTIVGIIETKENGDQVAREFNSRRIVGYYIATRDHTTDFYGRVIAKGNTVVSLLYQKN